MYSRFIEPKIKRSQLPVILINGARQVGKSTLVKKIFAETHTYITLDDPQILSMVRKDPLNFIRLSKGPLIIDEVQRCPDLLLAIKILVDEKRSPQQFILTGSVNVLQMKGITDSLAGRMAIYTLWPLSKEELHGIESQFLEEIFKGNISKGKADMSTLVEDVKKGGYPLSVLSEDKLDRHEWFQAYLAQLVGKDIRDLSNIEGLSEIPNILGVLASRVGGLLNLSDLSRSLQIPNTTLRRYLSLLELSFIFCPMRPWSGNIGKRFVKSEKVFLNDTALVESILHRDIEAEPLLFGHVLENFVGLELVKQLSYKKIFANIFHHRTVSGGEVDFIIESMDGHVVGFEVKGSSQFSTNDTKELLSLKEGLQEKFKMGIVLYRGDQVLPIEDKIYAIPLSYLWT